MTKETTKLLGEQWEVIVSCVPKYSSNSQTEHSIYFENREDAEKCYAIFKPALGQDDRQDSEKKEKTIEYSDGDEKRSFICHHITSIALTNRHKNINMWKNEREFMGDNKKIA